MWRDVNVTISSGETCTHRAEENKSGLNFGKLPYQNLSVNSDRFVGSGLGGICVGTCCSETSSRNGVATCPPKNVLDLLLHRFTFAINDSSKKATSGSDVLTRNLSSKNCAKA